jgi:hypothetical protein
VYFIFHFNFESNTIKYFQSIFQNANKHRKNKHFSGNHLHLKIFYDIKYFTSKQTKPNRFHFLFG